MPGLEGYAIRTLGPDDLSLMEGMLTVFGDAFEEPETYGSARPGPEYLGRLLGGPVFLAVAAVREPTGEVVGGIAAYVLEKFERERAEVYIYDLAVADGHRRRGIATALIGEVVRIAVDRGAHAVFVQADRGDEAAIALYGSLGTAEDVLHFDLNLGGRPGGPTAPGPRPGGSET